MKPPITVNLFGKSDSRSVEIQPRGGFFTRHIKAPREAVPSLFKPLSPTLLHYSNTSFRLNRG